jgi:hypothetical protein
MANGLKSESSVRLPSSQFDDGHTRIFGSERQPQRGKWVVDPKTGELIDIGEYVPPEPEPSKLQINTDMHYAGIRATDGTPLESRRAHQEYMRANGLALADDFKGTWERARAQRDARYHGDTPEDTRERKQALAETIRKLEANPRLAVRRREGVIPDE